MARKLKAPSAIAPIRQRHELSLIIRAGHQDRTCIASAIRGWVVPLLVRQFLSEHNAPTKTEVKSDNPTSKSLGKEAAVFSRTR